jgi:hypothetical protein
LLDIREVNNAVPEPDAIRHNDFAFGFHVTHTGHPNTAVRHFSAQSAHCGRRAAHKVSELEQLYPKSINDALQPGTNRTRPCLLFSTIHTQFVFWFAICTAHSEALHNAAGR